MKRLLVIALLFAAACLFHSQAQAGGFGIFGGVGVSVRAPLVDVQVGGGRLFAPRAVVAVPVHRQRVFVQRQFVAPQRVFVQRQFAVPVHQQRVFVQQVPVYSQQFAAPVCNDLGVQGFSYRSSVFGY